MADNDSPVMQDDEQEQPNFSPLALLASGGPLASRVAQRMAFAQGDVPGLNAPMPQSGGAANPYALSSGPRSAGAPGEVRRMRDIEQVAMNVPPSGAPSAMPPSVSPIAPAQAPQAGSQLAAVPPPPDQTGRMAYLKGLEQDAMKPAPSKANYKPSASASIGGALAAFGAGWQHNPNAVEVGRSVMDRGYNSAVEDWQRQHQQTESQIAQTRADMGDELAQYGLSKSAVEADWARNKDQSEITKNKAMADKLTQQGQHYEDMTAYERSQHIPEIEKGLGHALTPDQRDQFVINGKLDKAAQAKAPANYTEAVIAAQGEKDPKGPLHQSVKEIESHERSLRPTTPVQPTEYTDWRSQFQKENGRAPTSAEITSKYKNAGKDDDEGITAKQERTLKNDAQYQNYERQLKSISDTLAEESGLTDPKSKDRVKGLNDQMNTLIQQQEARKAQVLGTGKQPATTPQSNQPATTPQSKPENKPQAKANPPDLKPGSDAGAAPKGSPEGRTGRLPDGTPVVVKGGRLITQPKQISQVGSMPGNNF